MADFPSAGVFDNDSLTSADFQDYIEAFLAGARQYPGGSAVSALAIGSGSVTPTAGAHTVDTESSASTDDLTNIDQTNIRDGGLLLLWPASTSRVVTVVNESGGAGEILLAGGADYEMAHTHASLLLQRRGAQWYEVLRAFEDGPGARGQQLFTSSGTFNVPTGITTVYVTAIGGGGGGGGGAGSTGTTPGSGSDGSDGSVGSTTSFASDVVVSGGGGGGAGEGIGRGGPGGSPYGANGQNAVGDYGGYGGVPSQGILGSYGRGGAGGAGADDALTNSTGGGGGGAGGTGQAKVRQAVSVTPGGTKAVTIGAGGAGGAAGTGSGGTGTAGSTGTSGALLVEW